MSAEQRLAALQAEVERSLTELRALGGAFEIVGQNIAALGLAKDVTVPLQNALDASRG